MSTKRFGLNNNQLKILAIVIMTIDHVGMEIMPQFRILRIIGRLAFPIFAFMIAEGCHHTKNRKNTCSPWQALHLCVRWCTQ